jgi:hypothetical protein
MKNLNSLTRGLLQEKNEKMPVFIQNKNNKPKNKNKTINKRIIRVNNNYVTVRKCIHFFFREWSNEHTPVKPRKTKPKIRIYCIKINDKQS